jgi:hypothetical protein
MSSTTATETEEVRMEGVETHTEGPAKGKEKSKSKRAEPVEKPKKKRAKKQVEEESSEGEESSEASGDDADYDGSGKRKKGNAKGNTSKKTKNPTAQAEVSDTSTPTPTPKPTKKPAASWRSDETFVKALESGEATMETKFGGKGAVTVRFGHEQDMMQGYTLNLLAFIADPHMVYKEGSFQKQLARLILGLSLTKGLDQMMGRDDQPMVFEAHITAAKFKQVSAILLSMVRGISLRGTPDDKAFADVTEKVLGFMSSPDGILRDMATAGTEPYERYNMVMQSETNIKKAEMASAQRELNLVLGDLKLVGNAFPDVARRVTDVETMFGKKGKILEMAADTAITQMAMATRLDISNPDNDPATGTTLFGIDTALNVLVQHNTSPGFQNLQTIGALGVDIADVSGFDISLSGTAYGAFHNGSASELYTIDLLTGSATLVGSIGSDIQIRDLAVAVPADEENIRDNMPLNLQIGWLADWFSKTHGFP